MCDEYLGVSMGESRCVYVPLSVEVCVSVGV